MQRLVEDLRAENLKYKIKLEELERRLQESERARADLLQTESFATMSNMMNSGQNIVGGDSLKVGGQPGQHDALNELIQNYMRRGSVPSNYNNIQNQQ